MKTPEQLKGAIRNIAVKNSLHPQEVLQMFLFERILERLSVSPYHAHFILKGGLLISSMIGINERTTMDMDTTVQGIPMEETQIAEIVRSIIEQDMDDGIQFVFRKIEPIREDDEYSNFRVHLEAKYGKINAPMKIDITTGDKITPTAVCYSFPCLFEKKSMPVMAYTLETILAEKYETIIRRNIATTRSRDFYDLFTLFRIYRDKIRIPVLKEAVANTSEKRESQADLEDWQDIIQDIRNEPALLSLWKNYQADNPYARGILFEKVVDTVEAIGNLINHDQV